MTDTRSQRGIQKISNTTLENSRNVILVESKFRDEGTDDRYTETRSETRSESKG